MLTSEEMKTWRYIDCRDYSDAFQELLKALEIKESVERRLKIEEDYNPVSDDGKFVKEKLISIYKEILGEKK